MKEKCAYMGSTWSHVRFLCGCQRMYCHLWLFMYHYSYLKPMQ